MRRSPRDGEVPVENNVWGWCGVYDATWQDDVATLGPGEAPDLTTHLMPASVLLDFQRAGPTEVRVYYAWRGGQTRKGGPDADPPADLGPMKGVEPFDLVSAPVAIEVHRPVEVSVETRGTLHVGEIRTLADLLRVTVESRGDEALEFRPQYIQFVLGPTEPTDLLNLREDVTPQVRVRAAPLRAHGKRVYEGATAFLLLRH